MLEDKMNGINDRKMIRGIVRVRSIVVGDCWRNHRERRFVPQQKITFWYC